MHLMLRTILTSIAVSVLLGPIIVMLEMYVSKLLVQGVSEPGIILLYPFSLIPSAIIATPLAIAYALTLHSLLRLQKVKAFSYGVAGSCLFGAFVSFIISLAAACYVSYQNQLEANALYVGKLEAFKPQLVFLNSLFSETNLIFLIVPSLLCGALIPLLLPRPNPSFNGRRGTGELL